MIPDDWVRCKLGKLAKIKTGGTPKRMDPHYWGGDIPWMSSGEIHKRYINDTKEFITEDGLKSSNACLLPQETVMIALNGQGRTRGTVAILRTPVTCNQSLAGFITYNNILNADYLFFYLDSKYQSLRDLSGDHGRNGLNLKLLREIEIYLPPLPEQKKIAAILSSVDYAIQATQAVIDQTRRVKQGLLQQLLTRGIGHTRFKQTEIGEIPEDWDVKPLETLAKSINNGFVGTAAKHYVNDGIPYLMAKNIRENRIELGQLSYISDDFHKNNPRSFLETGDLLTVQSGHIGTSATVPLELSGANCHALIISKLHCEQINSDFVAYYFNSPSGRKRLSGIFVGTTIKHINTKDLRKFLVPLPSRAEQTEIANIFKDIDKNQDASKSFLIQLNQTKRGLMQDLLTGRVRVKPDEVNTT